VIAAALRTAGEASRGIGDIGTTTYRAPFTPVAFAALAGRQRGELFDPARVTSIHPWHVAKGALFEDVGQWKRPWYYPQDGEDMDAAVLRECAAVRDGVSRLLPVASIGGEAVGVRLACWKVHDLPAVIASVIVEVLITLAMQAIFATIGIAMLARSAALGRAAWPLAAASATTIVAVAASYVWLRHGAPFLTLIRVTRRVLGRCHSLLIAVPSCQLDDALRAQTHAPRRWLAALIAQLTGQVVGAFENQFALWAIGVPITFSNALAIEAVAQIARHVAFFVPLGVGVQDAAIVLTSQIAGLSTEAALSLALIKRMREVLSGGLGIGSWLLVEAARGSHLWDAEREKRQLH